MSVSAILANQDAIIELEQQQAGVQQTVNAQASINAPSALSLLSQLVHGLPDLIDQVAGH